MARGDKSAYTDKQKRKAEHIEESYRKRGLTKKKAQARAWATVNAQDGGGKLSGSGRRHARSTRGAAKKNATSTRSKKTTRSTTSKRTSASRSAAAKKGWATRRRNARAA